MFKRTPEIIRWTSTTVLKSSEKFKKDRYIKKKISSWWRASFCTFYWWHASCSPSGQPWRALVSWRKGIEATEHAVLAGQTPLLLSLDRMRYAVLCHSRAPTVDKESWSSLVRRHARCDFLFGAWLCMCTQPHTQIPEYIHTHMSCIHACVMHTCTHTILQDVWSDVAVCTYMYTSMHRYLHTHIHTQFATRQCMLHHWHTYIHTCMRAYTYIWQDIAT